MLGAAGFTWYEISNWAKSPAAQCSHNLLYWRNHHWWGAGPGAHSHVAGVLHVRPADPGPGAHSHVAGVRWSNVKDPDAWSSGMSAGDTPLDELEVLGPEEQALERLLLAIRLAEGLVVEGVAPDAVDRVVGRQLATVDDGRMVLTLEGRLLADEVVRTLAD